jgi:hypothetical protein
VVAHHYFPANNGLIHGNMRSKGAIATHFPAKTVGAAHTFAPQWCGSRNTDGPSCLTPANEFQGPRATRGKCMVPTKNLVLV